MVADLLNTCDVKISANSRSFNVDIHVYEHTNKAKIDAVINNAIYAMTVQNNYLNYDNMI